MKIIGDIIASYVTKERGKLSSPNQPAILIMDVFKGQMTNPFLKKLEEYNGAVVKWLSLLHNSIQLSPNLGSAQVQILLAACRRFAMVRISDNDTGWK